MAGQVLGGGQGVVVRQGYSLTRELGLAMCGGGLDHWSGSRLNIELGGIWVSVVEGEVQRGSAEQSEPSDDVERNDELIDLAAIYGVAIETAKSKMVVV